MTKRKINVKSSNYDYGTTLAEYKRSKQGITKWSKGVTFEHEEEVAVATVEKKIDVEDWISQRAESSEGPTISEFIEVFSGTSLEAAQSIFRLMEAEGLLFRQAFFAGKDRVYTDNAPIPAVITEDTALFYDIFDEALQESRGSKGGFRYKELISKIRDRHPLKTNIDVLKILHKLVKAKFLTENKNPVANMFNVVGLYTDHDEDDFDDWLTDKGDHTLLLTPRPEEFELFVKIASLKTRLLGSRHFGDEIYAASTEDLSDEVMEEEEAPAPVEVIPDLPTLTKKERKREEELAARAHSGAMGRKNSNEWAVLKAKKAAAVKSPEPEPPEARTKPPVITPQKSPLSWLTGMRMGALVSMAGKAITEMGDQIQEWNLEDEVEEL
jgi:hypothetical protein